MVDWKLNLKVAMNRVGIGNEALASRVDVHPNTVDKWKNQSQEMSLENAISVANALGMSLDECFVTGSTNDRIRVLTALLAEAQSHIQVSPDPKPSKPHAPKAARHKAHPDTPVNKKKGQKAS